MRAVAVIDSRMPIRTIAFLVVAILIAIACVRLGLWQLNRREMRRASNSVITARSGIPAVPIQALAGDTGQIRFRHVIVAGRPDYDNEIVLTHRGHNGSPGLDILTPVRLPGSDSAVLVNRGWIYAPDGMTANLPLWRESDTVFTGYVDTFERSSGDSLRSRGTRLLDYGAIARALPYPVRKVHVVALSPVRPADTAGGRIAVVRLDPPKLSEGPHFSYAIQWFGFAAIAIVGASIVTARSMRS